MIFPTPKPAITDKVIPDNASANPPPKWNTTPALANANNGIIKKFTKTVQTVFQILQGTNSPVQKLFLYGLNT